MWHCFGELGDVKGWSMSCPCFLWGWTLERRLCKVHPGLGLHCQLCLHQGAPINPGADPCTGRGNHTVLSKGNTVGLSLGLHGASSLSKQPGLLQKKIINKAALSVTDFSISQVRAASLCALSYHHPDSELHLRVISCRAVIGKIWHKLCVYTSSFH